MSYDRFFIAGDEKLKYMMRDDDHEGEKREKMTAHGTEVVSHKIIYFFFSFVSRRVRSN